MKTIKLYGKLGKLFGKIHVLNVKNAAEAVRALCCNKPELKKFLLENNDIRYKVFVDNENIDEKQLRDKAEKEIKIIPVVAGANDVVKIIIGAVLLYAAFTIAGPAGLAEAAWYIQATAMLGANLILSGTIGLLTPTPTTPESPEKIDSFGFNGAVNNVRQGGPVPLAYGELIVGSHVISAGLSTDQISV